jgi:hypothetical protein
MTGERNKRIERNKPRLNGLEGEKSSNEERRKSDTPAGLGLNSSTLAKGHEGGSPGASVTCSDNSFISSNSLRVGYRKRPATKHASELQTRLAATGDMP